MVKWKAISMNPAMGTEKYAVSRAVSPSETVIHSDNQCMMGGGNSPLAGRINEF